jgi:hypothetical protein
MAPGSRAPGMHVGQGEHAGLLWTAGECPRQKDDVLVILYLTELDHNCLC